jgi:hypothetical protein
VAFFCYLTGFTNKISFKLPAEDAGKEVEMISFRVGDTIVYHKAKSSYSPGPRARQVYPLARGEEYHYVVDKFWTVTGVNSDGTIDVVTRTGKAHRLPASDPNISRTRLFHHLVYRKRFPVLSIKK